MADRKHSGRPRHSSARGNDIIAQALAEYLRTEGLLGESDAAASQPTPR
jgi:hypothetical protein